MYGEGDAQRQATVKQQRVSVMRIVLVDPSRLTVRIISALLEARGHAVEVATDGREALALLTTDPDIDTLITAIELPSLSGFELCWEARLLSTARQRPLYVIVMSSSADDARLGEALDSGADDFISKPPSANALYARLRSGERSLRNEAELIRLASIDPLTELLNRRAFFERSRQAIERASSGAPLSAIMLDIDHFKQVNDRHGHDLGDKVLRAVAREAMRVSALSGRLGGEEFAVLLEGAAATADVDLANAFRVSCAEMRFDGKDGAFGISCSFGVARWEPDTTVDQLFKRADLSLYEAKRSGRNRVVCDHALPVGGEPAGWTSIIRSPRRAGREGGTRVECGPATPEVTYADAG